MNERERTALARRIVARVLTAHIGHAQMFDESLVAEIAGMLPAPRKPRAATALTPYGLLWHKRFGTNSEPPWKELAQQVPTAEAKVGREEALDRWARFLMKATESRFARPARWVQGLGEYGYQPPRL